MVEKFNLSFNKKKFNFKLKIKIYKIFLFKIFNF